MTRLPGQKCAASWWLPCCWAPAVSVDRAMPRTAVACARAWMVLLRSCMDDCLPARCARCECELSARRKQGYGREMSSTLQPCNGIVAMGRECVASHRCRMLDCAVLAGARHGAKGSGLCGDDAVPAVHPFGSDGAGAEPLE